MRLFHFGRQVLTSIALSLIMCGVVAAQESFDFSGLGGGNADQDLVKVSSVFSVHVGRSR